MCYIFKTKKQKKKGEKPLMSQFSAPITPDVPVNFPRSQKREDYIIVPSPVFLFFPFVASFYHRSTQIKKLIYQKFTGAPKRGGFEFRLHEAFLPIIFLSFTQTT